MRAGLDVEKLRRFMEGVGRSAQGPGRVYLVGGATALLLGIRAQTIDVDIKLDPEPPGIFEAIARLKEDLSVNVELAAPDDFLPALPGWRDRSVFISRSKEVEFFHYDFYAQVLSKLLRGHEKDVADARALVDLGKVQPARLLELFHSIEPDLIRYPALNPAEFKARVLRFANDDL